MIFLDKIAIGDGGGHFRDVANLAGEVRGHEVHVVREILPGARHAGHLRLSAELAFGAHFARHARDFRGEAVQLIDHRVDGVFQRQDFALHVHGNLAAQIAARDRRRDFGDVAHLAGEIGAHRVHGIGEILPGAGHPGHRRLPAELAFRADFARHARDFRGEAVELIDHGIDRLLQLENLALHIHGDFAGKIAARHRRGHRRDVADLAGQIRGHRVHGVGEILPGAGHSGHHRLSAEPAFRADLARHARDFRGEGAKLIDHRIGGFFELQNLAADIDSNLFGKVAIGDRNRHIGNVAHLRRQVARHLVHGFRQFLPDAGYAFHLRLAAELAFGADLARHARHLGGEYGELIDHGIDQLGRAQELALERAAVHFEFHGLPQVAFRHGPDGAGDIRRGPHQIVDKGIDGLDLDRPFAHGAGERHALLEAALLADRRPQPLGFLGDAVLVAHGVIEGLGDAPIDAIPIRGKPHGKIAIAERHHRRQKLPRTRICRTFLGPAVCWLAVGLAICFGRRGGGLAMWGA